jgi:UDP:flavonoid glycosyltransferase YjiC (YdhE family)
MALGNTVEYDSPSEEHVLRHANEALSRIRRPELKTLTELISDVDDTILLTIPELDHYGARTGARYWGVNTRVAGPAPDWLPGNRTRIFCYLKPTATLVDALSGLRQPDYDVLAFVPGAESATRERLSSAGLRFVYEPLDMQRTMESCHLAILNATHGSTAAALLAGKPSVHLPLYLEQSLIARCVRMAGAGVGIPQRQAQTVPHAVVHVLGTPAFTRNAQSIRDRHTSFDVEAQAQAIVDLLDQRVRKSGVSA